MLLNSLNVGRLLWEVRRKALLVAVKLPDSVHYTDLSQCSPLTRSAKEILRQQEAMHGEGRML